MGIAILLSVRLVVVVIICIERTHRNASESSKFPINIYPCLHLIWNLEECLVLMQVVNDHEILLGEEKPCVPITVDVLPTW